MHIDYDVVIAGGGMVGSMLACALGNTALRVAVLEPLPASPPPEHGYDLRVSAITLATRAIFQAVGAWPAMQERRLAPIREMRVWDAAGVGSIHFDSADIGQPELGYIIENSVIVQALHRRMQDFSNIRYLCPMALQGIERDVGGVPQAGRSAQGRRAHSPQQPPPHVALTTRTGERLSARVLVGADGAQSLVRRLAGIRSRGWEFDQKGIVATVKTSQPHRQTAWQRFLLTGPLAMLPLDDKYCCSIVWSADTARADQLLALEDGDFIAELQEAFGDALGLVETVGPRAAFPLALAYAEGYVQPGVALVGDAAHRVHPLAGQGVNLGFADAAVLAEVLLEAHGAHKDIGQYAVLRRYERWRKFDNAAMLAVTDGLKRLYGTRHAGIVYLRDLGMNLTDSTQPLKNKIMRLAAGLDGDLPRLARGARRF